MSKRLIFFLIIALFVISFFSINSKASRVETEKGTLSIYFMQEQVGYEEYSWEEKDYGYTLTVHGRMTKPVAIEIDELVIHLDRSFIPLGFLFKWRVSGVDQEVRSIISEGEVVSVKKVAGQEQTETVNIKRDAFLLPNPVFSPYMVLTKKFRCGLQEKLEISAYIIPQMEVPATLEPEEGAPCRLIMRSSTTQIELETNDNGVLDTIDIPSQNLRVLKTMIGHPSR
ncbi:MAG: hypothetical protein OEY18_02875 [Candidatus Aminicenantes bacterium]|nr:hypothetical protein [Candidatus Aminicenantes bacterium]MDH5383628.1 hypothetical protein [Candidatus Aminicenantes bacterium]MDH5742720.1 hypothetical protein [Candidatus Aminicenantes bacterium]